MYNFGFNTFFRFLFSFVIWFLIYTCVVHSKAYSEIIRSHGISTFGELKYDTNFPYFDYVNPNAPKGGEISIWGIGSFDSMHTYSTKGRAGRLSSIFF